MLQIPLEQGFQCDLQKQKNHGLIKKPVFEQKTPGRKI